MHHKEETNQLRTNHSGVWDNIVPTMGPHREMVIVQNATNISLKRDLFTSCWMFQNEGVNSNSLNG